MRLMESYRDLLRTQANDLNTSPTPKTATEYKTATALVDRIVGISQKADEIFDSSDPEKQQF